MDIAELLAFGVKSNASDLHLSAELPPMIRVDGDIRRINVPALDNKTVHNMIFDIMNDKQRKDFEEFLETDFSVVALNLKLSSRWIPRNNFRFDNTTIRSRKNTKPIQILSICR